MSKSKSIKEDKDLLLRKLDAKLKANQFVCYKEIEILEYNIDNCVYEISRYLKHIFSENSHIDSYQDIIKKNIVDVVQIVLCFLLTNKLSEKDLFVNKEISTSDKIEIFGKTIAFIRASKILKDYIKLGTES